MNRLNEQDAKYFYDLFIPFLEYINHEKKITDQLVIRNEQNKDKIAINPQNVIALTEAAYEDLSLIDSYLSHAGKTLSKEDRKIVQSWKRAYHGVFTIIKYTDDGALLLDNDYNILLVKGIYSSIEEMTGFATLPRMARMHLIPFRDVIITDGVISLYDVMIGENMASQLETAANRALNVGDVYKELPDDITELVSYDQKMQKNAEINQKYLDLFAMQKQMLSNKTIQKHLNNVDFYLNTYLFGHTESDMEEGIYEISSYLGDFFIRKCMWSSPYSIQTTAASLKKFYGSMKDHGLISLEDYKALTSIIKEEMDDWKQAYEDYYREDDDYFDDFF